MPNASKQEEKKVVDNLSATFPEFLGEVLEWQNGPENGPPDFLATTADGKQFGLEITEWLATDQTNISISNQESRIQLMQALAREKSVRPSPLTRVVICDRLNVPLRRSDCNRYAREMYKLISDFAPLWRENQALGIAKVSDFTAHSTLGRYWAQMR
jgi:hypothetical protein